MTRTIGAATAAIGLTVAIILAWFVLAIAAHATATNCGRACFDPGTSENPYITLIGGEQ
jgi:hypothetical protein